MTTNPGPRIYNERDLTEDPYTDEEWEAIEDAEPDTEPVELTEDDIQDDQNRYEDWMGRHEPW